MQTTHKVPMRDSKEHELWLSKRSTDVRLLVEGASPVGYYIGGVGADESCRRVHGGPQVPGPYYWASEHCAVIDNRGGSGAEIKRAREAGLVIEAKVGDWLEIDGTLWLIDVETRTYRGQIERLKLHEIY